MSLERQAGRHPRDTRYSGSSADIESPPRLIEVKAFGKSTRGNDLWLEVRQVEEGLVNPNFYLYVVERVRQGDPALFTLKVLGEERLARLLERAKEQRYYTVPWPVADYDSAPTDVDAIGHVIESAPPAPDEPASVIPDSAGDEVIVFRGDDESYLRWLSEHPRGLVVNAQRNPKPSYLKLHRATCTWMSGRRKPGAYTEREYIKICSASLIALELWGSKEVGGALERRCSCL